MTPWDRNRPNPALIEALRDRSPIFGSPFKEVDGKKTQTRKMVLVPGCGRGYDVLLFSSYGFNAVGLDVSPTAREEATKTLSDPSRDERYPIKNVQEGRGEARFITADFFSDNFLSETHGSPSSGKPRTFDVIYDYTFLCALAPEMRPQWAARMSELLSPEGTLICMEYPLGRERKLGGPPHGLQKEVYEQVFARPGAVIGYDDDSDRVREELSDPQAENALVRVERWDPPETFEDQKGSIMVSAWRHWKP